MKVTGIKCNKTQLPFIANMENFVSTYFSMTNKASTRAHNDNQGQVLTTKKTNFQIRDIFSIRYLANVVFLTLMRSVCV